MRFYIKKWGKIYFHRIRDKYFLKMISIQFFFNKKNNIPIFVTKILYLCTILIINSFYLLKHYIIRI